ncbi:MAG: zinc-binding dehydrogenase, partial [Gemmatimonadetes bacterium]|nr:zinc-binding dehydrogenase [Gemmatimonadota bacterium]
AQLLSLFVGQRLTAFIASEKAADMAKLAELVAEGKVTPQVDKVFPLEEAADAMRHLTSGTTLGKVAISCTAG